MKTTYFAPAERDNMENLWEDNKKIHEYRLIQNVIDAVPNIVMVLNRFRQVVFFNEKLSETLSLDERTHIIGKRPGELLHCVHSLEMPGGCGTSESCEYCGAVLAIINSQKGTPEVRECRVLRHTEAHEEALDLRITATLLQIDDDNFTFLTIDDISNEKRRSVLERVFFHDVLNTASVIKNSAELIAMDSNSGQYQEFAMILPNVADRLIDEIKAQRQLLRAENGELEVSISLLSTQQVIQTSIEHARGYFPDETKRVEQDGNRDNVYFEADATILHRVLSNMLKNALEATERNGTVRICCTRQGERLRFEVRNAGMLSRAVQLQVFQRSFSTKGTNRGIGTYSMKLLTERYLNGKIGFSTDKDICFYIVIPMHPEMTT
jgi:signal transduction histidine kinase